MHIETIITRARDISATKRKRGNPKNNFVPFYSSDFGPKDVEPSTSKRDSPIKGSRTGDSELGYTQPLLSVKARQMGSFYTIGEYFRRNIGTYIEIVRKAGIPYYDVGDVVQDAITSFLENTSISVNEMMTKDQIESCVRSKMLLYLQAQLVAYSLEKITDVPNEEEIAKPVIHPDYTSVNIILHMISEKPIDTFALEENHPCVSGEALSAEALIRVDTKYVKMWLEEEIYEAITEVNISLPDLRRRYSFKKEPKIFSSFADMGGNLDERLIADYVAFGTETLERDELLQSPLFYEALHSVLEKEYFGKREELPVETVHLNFVPFTTHNLRKFNYQIAR